MPSEDFPRHSYSDFALRLKEKTLARRVPLSGILELTYRCNFNCVHCYNPTHGSEGEMGTESVKEVLDQLARAGCLSLVLSGGEVMMRSDFLEIYTHAKGLGFLTTVFTNGSLVTDRVIDLFRELPPRRVEVSIYGMTDRTTEAVTCTGDALKRTLAGVERLHRERIPLKLKTMAMTLNVAEIKEMRAFAQGLGVPFLFDAGINPCLNGEATPVSYRLTPEEVLSLDREDPDYFPRLREHRDYYRGRRRGGDLLPCSAGRNFFGINPYGHLMNCIMMPQLSYDIVRGGFTQCWRRLWETRPRKEHSDSLCTACEHYFICGQCPAWSYLEHRDYDQPVDYLHRIALLRAEQLEKGD